MLAAPPPHVERLAGEGADMALGEQKGTDEVLDVEDSSRPSTSPKGGSTGKYLYFLHSYFFPGAGAGAGGAMSMGVTLP